MGTSVRRLKHYIPGMTPCKSSQKLALLSLKPFISIHTTQPKNKADNEPMRPGYRIQLCETGPAVFLFCFCFYLLIDFFFLLLIFVFIYFLSWTSATDASSKMPFPTSESSQDYELFYPPKTNGLVDPRNF